MDKTKKACVVIPVYREEISATEQIALDQCFRVLANYDIFFVIPERLKTFIGANEYVQSGAAQYRTFNNNFFQDIPSYNRLLKYPGFYKSFLDYEFLLIYQLDAFVFKDELMEWCARGYSNIGAPLFEGHEKASLNSPLVGQGNGGFCLRKVKHCYDAVTHVRKLPFKKTYTDANRSIFRNIYRYIKHQVIYIYSYYPFQPMINEDLFWAVEIPAVFPWFKVPEPEEAIGFSFEVNPGILYEHNHQKLPFGCHAWERYDLNFWRTHLKSFGYEI